MDIVSRIILTMEQKGINGVQLGELLGKRKSPVTDWKNGKSKPTLEQVMQMCEIFATSSDYLLFGIENLPPTLRGDEKRLLRLYNELNDSGRRLTMLNVYKALKKNKEDREWWETHRDAVDRLMLEAFGPNLENYTTNKTSSSSDLDDWDYNEDDFERDDTPYPILKSLPSYYIKASAGTGTFLDSSDYELLDLPVDKVPIQTTFCVSITGDSMMPDYENDDMLFVKQQPTLNDNELGIFVLNGEALFKKLVKSKSKYQLVSLNSKYKPIDLHAHDVLRVVGKVIGRYTEG